MAQPYSLNKNKYLLPPEAEHLRKIIETFQSNKKETRNCLIMSLALRTGARASELLGITKADINVFHKAVLIRGIKGSNDREIPLEPKFFDLFYKFSLKISGQKLFDISYGQLRNIWLFYRPINKNFHSLRHTFAIELYQKTKDLRLVQVALGHRSIINTMIYADYIYSQQELRRLLL